MIINFEQRNIQIKLQPQTKVLRSFPLFLSLFSILFPGLENEPMNFWTFSRMCGSRKYPYSPHRRDWKFRGGGGVSKSQKSKAMYEAKLEFPEGWGGHRENPFRGGVWIFSGTTQFNNSVRTMEVLNGGAFDSVNCQDVGIWPELNARGFA